LIIAEAVAKYRLQKIGERPPLAEYLRDSYKRRSFAFTLARFNLQASTAKSSLGVAWLVLVPALQIMVYGLIFGLVLGSSRPANFLPYLITGIVLFQFVAGSFADGAKSITANASLVRSLNFPRVLLPTSAVISNVIRIVPLVGLMLIALFALGEPITWNWLLVIPDLILMACFSAGLAMIAARLTVHFADLNQLVPFITRVAFYSSGIFFSVDKLAAGHPILQPIMDSNPIHIFLQIARGALVQGYSYDLYQWIFGAIWALASLILGFVYFWRAEEKFGRNV
jgi:teichoic acid transport system permease protein